MAAFAVVPLCMASTVDAMDFWTRGQMEEDTELGNGKVYRFRVFSELVYNTDANLGNLANSQRRKLWMLDFTWAVRLHEDLQHPKALARIDRRLPEGLRSFGEAAPVSELSPGLSKDETRALLTRRNRAFRQQGFMAWRRTGPLRHTETLSL